MKKRMLAAAMAVLFLFTSMTAFGATMKNKGITRGEFALMLHHSLKLQIEYFRAPEIKEFFKDVKSDATYADELIDLATVGIIDDRGSFYPNRILTKEEMLHYGMNALKYKLGDRYKEVKLAPIPFKDEKQIRIEYQGDINRAVYYKLVAGKAFKNISPKEKVTREKGEAFLKKLLAVIEKSEENVQIKTSAVIKDGALEMKISLMNNTGKAVHLVNTSGQIFDFMVLDQEKKVQYTWSADKSFLMVLTTTTIEAGKSIEYVERIDKETFAKLKDHAAFVRGFFVGTLDTGNAEKEGALAEIKGL